MKTSAWRTDNFELNPVFLWCHSDETPPIGRVFDLHAVARELRGSVRYAETEFADTIYQLVRGNFLNATSTSWRPIAWDRMSSGGCMFTDVDLLEISQVGVPALPTALAQPGARRLNLRPLRRWAEAALD
ncbi:MAG TPA: HK97 family phage prohead protease, partial [Steroidobacteraceae bacterium]|nr:HK97 family phage prohead protease [Steroidobacteraceae bacterium]